jgi:membrane protease YdiL (CAAX protease family)
MYRKAKIKYPKYENSAPKSLVIALTAVFFACLCYVVVSIIDLAKLTERFQSYEQVAEALTSGGLLVQILATGIAAPIAEELCNRGIVLNRLCSWMPKWAAILVGSALFGLIHLNLLQGMYAFVISIAMSAVYLRYRKLWVPIVGHMALNLASILMQAILHAAGVEEFSTWLLLIPSALIAAACGFMLLKRTATAVLIPEPEPELDLIAEAEFITEAEAEPETAPEPALIIEAE